jgi:Alkylmercury lyase
VSGGSVAAAADRSYRRRRLDDADVRIRNLTSELFVEIGRAPTAEEASLAAGTDVRESWWRLHEAHALVLDAAGEIRMANPFSAVPTPYRVQTAGRPWYANRAWDAFGIRAALGRCDEAERARPGVVGRPPRARLASAHARAEPGDP